MFFFNFLNQQANCKKDFADEKNKDLQYKTQPKEMQTVETNVLRAWKINEQIKCTCYCYHLTLQ